MSIMMMCTELMIGTSERVALFCIGPWFYINTNVGFYGDTSILVFWNWEKRINPRIKWESLFVSSNSNPPQVRFFWPRLYYITELKKKKNNSLLNLLTILQNVIYSLWIGWIHPKKIFLNRLLFKGMRVNLVLIVGLWTLMCHDCWAGDTW